MKLKIKETGEILEDVKFIDTTLRKITIQYLDDGVPREYSIKNLSDVEEVKDYEEPKWYWYINCFGKVLDTLYNGNEWDERRKLIGNYFLSREEAELAARKLKVWERLKEKGFRFAYCEEVEGYDDMIRIMAYPGECDMNDVEELFGGEK